MRQVFQAWIVVGDGGVYEYTPKLLDLHRQLQKLQELGVITYAMPFTTDQPVVITLKTEETR